jgi:uncharacterized protein YqjF (DUF2071 family)
MRDGFACRLRLETRLLFSLCSLRCRPLGAEDVKARQRLAEYLLRVPLSLLKMTWNAQTKTVLYRSSRNWNTKRNFELFSRADFIAALSKHIPPKSFRTIRYYGLYSNKSRGMRRKISGHTEPPLQRYDGWQIPGMVRS